MDPITAALTLATRVIDLYIKNLESMPEDAKAEYGRMIVEDMKAWREFLKLFKPVQP